MLGHLLSCFAAAIIASACNSDAEATPSPVMLELELRDGENLVSTPSILTMPGVEAMVSQSFARENQDPAGAGSLQLTLRPDPLGSDKCTVHISATMTTSSGEDVQSWTVSARPGEWIDAMAKDAMKVRMRCSAPQT